MGYIRQTEYPATEPVSVAEASDWLHVASTDSSLPGLITTAREQVETFTSRSCASRRFEQTLDSFPYFVDSVQSQLAFPPAYSSLPRYSTTLWNYSQMITLGRSPLISVERITYIGNDALPHDLLPGVDFVVDYHAEPPRLFPLPGGYWPPCYYVPNAVTIFFVAGYDPNPTQTVDVNQPEESPEQSPDSDLDITTGLPSPVAQQAGYRLTIGVPQSVRTAILMLVAHYYFNREPIVAGGNSELPMGVTSMLWSQTVFFASTRG